MAIAKKAVTKKPTTKKATAKKPSATRKPATKKAPAKKPTTKKTTNKKAPAKKTSVAKEVAKSKQTQKAMILAVLKRGRLISAKQAEDLCGCMRLAAVICDLRKRGYVIETRMCVGKNKIGGKSEFAKYKLISAPQVEKKLPAKKKGK